MKALKVITRQMMTTFLVSVLAHTSAFGQQARDGMLAVNPIHAQTKSAAMEAYLKWRDEAFVQLPDGTNTPHHALAATVQRLDAESLKIEFVVVGLAYSLEVQPLTINRTSDGQRREKAGKLTTSSLSAEGEPSIPNALSEATLIVPASAEANAVEITWKYRAEGQQMAPTLTISFENDAASTTMMGVTP